MADAIAMSAEDVSSVCSGRRENSGNGSHRLSNSGGSSANLAMQQILAPSDVNDEEPENEEQTSALVLRAMSQVEADFEPRTWQVFSRSVIDQIATSVVADEFGISHAAVRQIRSRILRRVRQQLGDMD